MPASLQRLFRWLRIVGTAILCLVILAAAAAAVYVINRTEPKAEQINSTRKSAALVETVIVHRSDYRPKLVVLGTVTPAQDIILSPRVRGQVLKVADSFVPGQTVKKDELLLQIDPADFNHALAIRESELEQAKASLKIEEGQGELAKKELALLEDTIQVTNRDLVLRVPQIESIRAQVKAAEAAVNQANLDLERTCIYAPFDAQILRRSVNVGSQVAPGDELAQLVGIKEYWIMATVPVRSLRWVQFPSDQQEGSSVTLRNPGTWPPGAERHARVSRMIGTLDQETRLARVLITVNDPLGTETGAPPLIIDTLVETHIDGRAIENVVRLSRDYIRSGDSVWVMKDNKLNIRYPTIVFRDAEFAYISDGLEDGEEVVITTLATVAEGIGLKKDSSSKTDIETNRKLEEPDTELERETGEKEQPSEDAKERTT